MELYFDALGQLWLSQNKIYDVDLNRVSLPNTRPKTIHWAEVQNGFFVLQSIFVLSLIVVYKQKLTTKIE